MFYYVKSNFDDAERLVRNMPEAFGDADLVLDSFLDEMANEVFATMQEPGTEIEYPVNWDSEKQRRAFFATNGFGAGIPYQRTGTLEGEWIKDAIEMGYEVLNPDPIAHYVYGTLTGGISPSGGGPSRIHEGRWPAFHLAVSDMLERWTSTTSKLNEIMKAIIEVFTEALRK
jgi:hypothetical protein